MKIDLCKDILSTEYISIMQWQRAKNLKKSITTNLKPPTMQVFTDLGKTEENVTLCSKHKYRCIAITAYKRADINAELRQNTFYESTSSDVLCVSDLASLPSKDPFFSASYPMPSQS